MATSTHNCVRSSRMRSAISIASRADASAASLRGSISQESAASRHAASRSAFDAVEGGSQRADAILVGVVDLCRVRGANAIRTKRSVSSACWARSAAARSVSCSVGSPTSRCAVPSPISRSHRTIDSPDKLAFLELERLREPPHRVEGRERVQSCVAGETRYWMALAASAGWVATSQWCASSRPAARAPRPWSRGTARFAGATAVDASRSRFWYSVCSINACSNRNLPGSSPTSVIARR